MSTGGCLVLCATLLGLALWLRDSVNIWDEPQYDPYNFDPSLPPHPRSHDVMRAAGYRLYRQLSIETMSDEPLPLFQHCRAVCTVVQGASLQHPLPDSTPNCTGLSLTGLCRNATVDSVCRRLVCLQDSTVLPWISTADPVCRCEEAVRCENHCWHFRSITLAFQLVAYENDTHSPPLTALDARAFPPSLYLRGTTNLRLCSSLYVQQELNVPCHGDFTLAGRIRQLVLERHKSLIWLQPAASTVDWRLAYNEHQGALFLGTRRSAFIHDTRWLTPHVHFIIAGGETPRLYIEIPFPF